MGNKQTFVMQYSAETYIVVSSRVASQNPLKCCYYYLYTSCVVSNRYNLIVNCF